LPCYLQAVVERYEAVMKKLKESYERIEANRHKMSLMSAKHQHLVNRLSLLEAAIELKKSEHEQVPHLTFNALLDSQRGCDALMLWLVCRTRY